MELSSAIREDYRHRLDSEKDGLNGKEEWGGGERERERACRGEKVLLTMSGGQETFRTPSGDRLETAAHKL